RLEVGKKERLVFPNGAADRGAELVLRVPRFRSAVEIGASIENGVLIELVRAAVELVCARLHYLVEDCATVVAVLRGEAVVLDLHFLQRFDSRLVVDVRGAAFPLLRCGGQGAVQANLGGSIALPIRNKI